LYVMEKIRAKRNTCARLLALDWIGLVTSGLDYNTACPGHAQSPLVRPALLLLLLLLRRLPPVTTSSRPICASDVECSR